MRKWIAGLFVMVLALSLPGCSKQTADTQPAVGRAFIATVTDVNEDTITVMPDEGYDEHGMAMGVGLNVSKSDMLPDVSVGDRVRIDYDGTVTRSIPGRLGQIYSFEILQ